MSPSVSLAPNLMPRLSAVPPAAAAAPAAQPPAPLVVTELNGELLSAKGPVKGLQAMQFGRVVDAQGITVARVMVLRLLDEALLATVIAGKDRIKPGLALIFDPPSRAAP